MEAQETETLGKELGDGSCFLNTDQDMLNYKANFNACRPQLNSENKPSLILWGDSYAAHLYPGYKESFGEKYKITQRTTSACPPILDMEIDRRPLCKEINDYIFASIKNEKPGKVVLSANWADYDWKKIAGTVAQLKKIGVNQIDLIGTVPHWHDSLYKQLYLKYKSERDKELPYRMDFGLSKSDIYLEPLLTDLSNRLDVNYISSRKIMCNEAGCLTRIGEKGEVLTTYDAGHLTEMGSRFLVSKFPKK